MSVHWEQVLVYDQSRRSLLPLDALAMLAAGKWSDFPSSQKLRDAIEESALEHPGLGDWPGGESVAPRRGKLRYYEFDLVAVREYGLVLQFFDVRGFTVVSTSESRDDG